MKEVAEGTRLEFPCRSCGSTLSYAAGQGALVCEHCGSREEIPATRDGVVEHAFESYDRPTETGWGTETRTYVCRQCGATTTVEARVASFTCPFCESNQVDATEAAGRLRPESVVPFAFDRDQAAIRIRTWIAGLWFRPRGLAKLSRVDRIHGVYLPHWTYDTLTRSFWEAEAGYHYYEEESYTDAEGKRRTRQVQKTRWEPAHGHHEAFFDDVLVPATQGADRDLLRAIAPFRTDALAGYDARYLAGWAAEDYAREMPACWPDAKASIDASIRSACASRVPGDTHRNLEVRTTYLNRTYKLCLLPVWICSYRYQGTLYPVLVNGQTGEVQGQAPLSWAKVVGLVAGIAAAAIAIAAALSAAGVL